MAQQPHLDDRYTTGVYYDLASGEYCEIVELDNTIGLCEPGRDEPYYTFDEDGFTKAEAIVSINKDFTQISEHAIEDPVQVVENLLRWTQINGDNELSAIPEQEAIDLGYARSQVNIVEQ
jgi:hypothetical protein